MGSSGDRGTDLSEFPDSSSSEYSYSGASQTDSAKPNRRPYKRAAKYVKVTSEYADKRSRNNAAVQKFRTRSKTNLKAVEEDINTYASLVKLFDNENRRLEERTKILQNLLQQHYHGAPVSDEIHHVIDSEAEARRYFTESVDTLKATLNDTGLEWSKKS